MIFALGEQLHEITLEQAAEENIPAIYLTTSANCYEVLQKAGITYEGEINLDDAYFCKLETQQDCLYGTLAIPRLLDVLGTGTGCCFLSTAIPSSLWMIRVFHCGF